MVALLFLAAAAALTIAGAVLTSIPAGLFAVGCWCGVVAWLLSE